MRGCKGVADERERLARISATGGGKPSTLTVMISQRPRPLSLMELSGADDPQEDRRRRDRREDGEDEQGPTPVDQCEGQRPQHKPFLQETLCPRYAFSGTQQVFLGYAPIPRTGDGPGPAAADNRSHP